MGSTDRTSRSSLGNYQLFKMKIPCAEKEIVEVPGIYSKAKSDFITTLDNFSKAFPCG